MSTRRARIKAVAVLPPRRKNAEKNKGLEAKEGFEANLPEVKSVRPASVEQSPKRRRLSKERNEDVPTRLLQMSVDKSPRGLRLSVEKATKESEDGVQAKSRRISVDKNKLYLSDKSSTEGNEIEMPCTSHQKNKTPKSSTRRTPELARLSADETANRLEDMHHTSVINSPAKECHLIVDKNAKCSPVGKTIDKSMRKDKIWIEQPSQTINPLKSNPTGSNTQNKTHQTVSLDKPSISNENDRKAREKATIISTPFFASPDPVTRPSVVVRTPVIEVDLVAEKLIAPHKGRQTEYRHVSYTEKLPKPTVQNERDLNTQNSFDINGTVEKINSNKCRILENALTGGKKASDQIQILDDYVIKPLQETSGVMDGIVPLKPARNVPKPLDILKNEIISENAQVFFDPIIPLPSPTKARPKLRPAPRLAPRRNSIQQSSASESEDDNRRSLHGGTATPIPSRQRDVQTPIPSRQRHDSHTPTPVRQRHDSQTHPRQRHDSQTSQAQPLVQKDVARVRNDSVCSNISQPASQITAVGSPLRDRQKIRRDEHARRNAALRKRKIEVDRDKLTMYDLIFYNPTTNPIIPDEDEVKAKEANEKDKVEAERKAKIEKDSGKESDSAPVAVPQIKLGPNGEIILDEQSLVVNQFDTRKLERSVVREGAWGGSNSTAYRRQPRTADWTDAETVRFYRALASLGTDFSMMTPLFPTRTRRDLKLKFKKEERSNFAQVDMALRSGAKFDPTGLEKEFNEERKLAEEAVKRAKERLQREMEEEKQRKIDLKKLKARPSRCAKTLGSSALPSLDAGKTTPTTIDDYVKFQLERSKKTKKCGRKRKPSSLVPTKKPPIPKTPKTQLKPKTVVSPIRSTSPSLAALRLLERHAKQVPKTTPKASAPSVTTIVAGLEVASRLPPNLEPGSVVLMTVNDPQSPSTQVLHAFYAKGQGEFATVNPSLLGGLGGLIKSNSNPPSSPRVRTPKTPIANTRNRNNSYTITQLE